MEALPWTLPVFDARFAWLVKLTVDAGAPFLWTDANRQIAVGSDQYVPGIGSRIVDLGDFGKLDSRLTRNSFVITLLDGDWAIRTRIEEAGGAQGSRAEIRLTDGSDHHLMRVAFASGMSSVTNSTGRVTRLSFVDPLQRNKDTKLRIVDDEVQRHIAADDDCFALSAVPFSGTWGYESG